MPERPEDVRAFMTTEILDRGHLIQFVPADAQSVLHGAQPYAYTVGRTMAGRPEWLVTGLPVGLCEVVLNELVRLDDVDRPPVETLAETARMLDMGDGPVPFKLILADQSPLLGAMAFFGAGRVVVLQALWPRDEEQPTYPSLAAPWPEQPIHPHGRTPLSGPDPYA